MSRLTPFLRIYRLDTNVQLSTTVELLDWSYSSVLDSAGQFMVEIAAGDPGSAHEGDLSCAEALLRAGPNLLTHAAPLPLLLELSLDGGDGTHVDSRRIARNPQRTLTAARRAIKDEGADLGDALSLAVLERVTYNDMPLQDVLNADASTLRSSSGWGIGATDVSTPVSPLVPRLAGVLQTPIGLASWATGGRNRLVFRAVVNPDVKTQSTTLDADSVTVMSILQTICNRLAGAAPAQSYGHWVADTSDVSLNLSSHTDGTSSWALTTPRSNAIVIGHQGADPWLTFDATATSDVDETTTALVQTEQSSVVSDDTGLYRTAIMCGGKSQKGIPDDARITGMAVINESSPPYGTMSTNRYLWTDCLLLIGAAWNNVGGVDVSGGVFYLHPDDVFRPIPGSPARACHALGYDNASNSGGGREPGLLFGSTTGVFYSTDNTETWVDATAWKKLEGLDDDIVRIQVENDTDHLDYPIIFVHSRGRKESSDAIWRWAYQGDPASWCWKSVITNQRITDFTITDKRTVWIAFEQKDIGDHLYQYTIDPDGTHRLLNDYQLPHHGTIRHVQRVVTTNVADDSVWVLIDGDQTIRDVGTSTYPSPAYYLLNGPHTDTTYPSYLWAGFYNANADGTLCGPAPDKPVVSVHRAFGGGITFEPTSVSGSGTQVNVFLATSTGVLWTDRELETSDGFNWRRVSLGGLDNYACDNIAAGAAQVILGRGSTSDSPAINRIFVLAADDILVSQSAGRWFRPLKQRERTEVAPYLSEATRSLTDCQGAGTGNTWPHNYIRSWGTTNSDALGGGAMTHTPLSDEGADDASHVYIPHTSPYFVPKGLFWQRDFDQTGQFCYRLQSQVSPLPGVQMSNLPAPQTRSSAVTARSAAEGVAIVAYRFLLQHHEPIVTLTIQSSFTRTDAALRTLRASMRAAVVGDIRIVDVSSEGVAVSTDVLHLDGSEAFYCLSHVVKKGPGATASTTTTLCTVLSQHAVSPDDIANAILDGLHQTQTWR